MIDIRILREFEGGPIGYYARGHHDPAAFVAAVAEFDDAGYDAACVRLEYWRNLPAPDGSGGSIYVKARKPGRGAYPVTVVE